MEAMDIVLFSEGIRKSTFNKNLSIIESFITVKGGGGNGGRNMRIHSPCIKYCI